MSSTIIIITPPPKSPFLREDQQEQQFQDQFAKLDRALNQLREAGFDISVKTESEDPESTLPNN